MSAPRQLGSQLGRTDQTTSVLSWRARANLTLALLVAAVAGGWHLAVAWTASGVATPDVAVTLRALLSGHPLDVPGAASTTTTLAVFGALAVAAFGLFVLWAFTWAAWRAKHRRTKGFAGDAAVREGLGEARARAGAAQTRPGMTDAQRKKAPVSEVGLPMGATTGGQPVVLALEDHVGVVAPTGAGKSRDVMIPAALDAPGALVVTCTRADILDVVATRRGAKGRVWVFDPLDRLGWPEPMVWNPVAGCADAQTAISRGLAFAAGLSADDKSSTNAGFFRANASSALTRLLHAADLDGRPVSDVIEWAIHLDDGAEEAQAIIRTSTDERAETMWAGLLRSVATGADETVASSRQTLQQAVEPMAMRRVTRWVTPREDVPTFDPAAFVASTDTLFLVADANASTNVAPLCAMLLQEVVDAAKAAAARLPGGRLDPPLRLVGDEIANVAPLPKLPDLGTDARGFGMQLVLALQSLAQARRRWGRDGANALMDNMPAELLLGGLTDTDALNRYSALVGDVELTRATISYDQTTGRMTSSSEQLADRKVLRADEARQIPDGHALLIYRNRGAVLLRMTPWFERSDAKTLSADRDAVEKRRLAGSAAARS
ncbi:type IV secretory system conjugative DNA transfer family protein [Pseudokineococcus marinus]|uniref:Type IV secretory system conjugative DNA transfer family protein n=1 Tax=Pseudokineococcus marinus TaxID=351215 RepID=A0A849BW03_9ACTN|nr:type IV secretory system conjugative DNA transfer family protein [Pseudokineococcus marinus]NNH21738.1 type IV secretory system conjugative DNA transfer family protein [Pseudokineococcus marinus]